jgi:hypothetical protein
MNRLPIAAWFFLVAITFCAVNGHAQDLSTLVQEGDILFQQSRSRLSKPIQEATGSRYTHTGMLLFRDGNPYVYEAVGPVRYTKLSAWVERGVDAHVVVKRLLNAERWLTPGNLKRMRQSAKRLRGLPYDFKFEWSEEAIYCSELVFKIFLEGAGIVLGQVERIGDLDLGSPSVQALVKRHRRGLLDHSEPIITPVSIFRDPRLETIFEGSL